MVHIISWNTLYREYEEKYNPSSEILKKFPSEIDRIFSVYEIIKNNLNPDSIVCLQECSKELAKLLKNINSHNLFMEKVRDEEYLLILAPKKDFYTREIWEPHPSANAYQIVSNNTYRIVNCHLVPQKYSETNVLAHILHLPQTKITIVAGDFNETYGNVAKNLENRYIIPRYSITYKHKAIDYIIVDENIKYEMGTINTFDISDHNMISLTF